MGTLPLPIVYHQKYKQQCVPGQKLGLTLGRRGYLGSTIHACRRKYNRAEVTYTCMVTSALLYLRVEPWHDPT